MTNEMSGTLRAWALIIFRRTSSTSEKPAVSLKATSPSVANSGRPVANEPDDATIASSLFDQKINTEITGGAFVNP